MTGEERNEDGRSEAKNTSVNKGQASVTVKM